MLEPAGHKSKDRTGGTDPPSRDSSKKRKRRRSRDETREREEDAAGAGADAEADADAVDAAAAAAAAADAVTSTRVDSNSSKSKKSTYRAAAAVSMRSRSDSNSFERPKPASPSPGGEAEAAKRNGSTDRDARREAVRGSPLHRSRSGSGQRRIEGPAPPPTKPPVPAKKGSSGKKVKLKGGKGSSLLSFGDDIGEGDESAKAEFQVPSLRAVMRMDVFRAGFVGPYSIS